MTYGTVYMTYGTLYMTYGTLSTTYGTVYMTYGTVYMTYGTVYMTYGTVYMTYGTVYMTYGTVYMTLGTQNIEFLWNLSNSDFGVRSHLCTVRIRAARDGTPPGAPPGRRACAMARPRRAQRASPGGVGPGGGQRPRPRRGRPGRPALPGPDVRTTRLTGASGAAVALWVGAPIQASLRRSVGPILTPALDLVKPEGDDTIADSLHGMAGRCQPDRAASDPAAQLAVGPAVASARGHPGWVRGAMRRTMRRRIR
jgi:hypothetical protein